MSCRPIHVLKYLIAPVLVSKDVRIDKCTDVSPHT